MDIRNHRLSIHNYRLGTHNHRFGISNGCVGIDRQLGLKGSCSVRGFPEEPAERTLKTWRTLTRSCFQAAILSLSSLERMNRNAALRLPRLVTLLWILVRVLRLGDL